MVASVASVSRVANSWAVCSSQSRLRSGFGMEGIIRAEGTARRFAHENPPSRSNARENLSGWETFVSRIARKPFAGLFHRIGREVQEIRGERQASVRPSG